MLRDDDKRAPYIEFVPDDALLETSNEAFDRIAFAERALAVLRPRRVTVAICRGTSRVRVEQGREWRGVEGERWAILSVPPFASRRAIAVAVAALAGATGEAPPPYALDALAAAGSVR